MALLNQATREITGKVVYYGPGLCGKTTNLQFIYDNIDEEQKGKMLSLATDTDRTIFFDFLPMDLGKVRGFKVRVQLYTVPGQVFYEETRRRVLKGADGIVFVADSQKTMKEANMMALKELFRHMKENGLDPETLPLVLQYNKRDLKNIMPVEEMDADLNPDNKPFFEAIAYEGVGVEDTLKAVSRLVLKKIMGQKPEPARDKEKEKEKEKEKKKEAQFVMGKDRPKPPGPVVLMDKAKLLTELGIGSKPRAVEKLPEPEEQKKKSAKATAAEALFEEEPLAVAAPEEEPLLAAAGSDADPLLSAEESPLSLDDSSQDLLGGQPQDIQLGDADSQPMAIPPEPEVLQAEEDVIPLEVDSLEEVIEPEEEAGSGGEPPSPAAVERASSPHLSLVQPASVQVPIALTPGGKIELPVEIGGKRFVLTLRLEPAE